MLVLLFVLHFIYGLNYALYMLDEDKIAEYRFDDVKKIPVSPRTTIRVLAPENPETLTVFLAEHSRCAHVEAVQVVWMDPLEEVPKRGHSQVDWSKVYWDVRAERSDKDVAKGGAGSNTEHVQEPSWAPRILSSLPLTTESVLLLDPELLLTCDTIKLAVRTWATVPTSMGVGFFPRLHTRTTSTPHASSHSEMELSIESDKTDKKDSVEVSGKTSGDWQLLSAWHVWWNRAHSIMLPLALITSSKYVQGMQDAVMAVKNSESGSGSEDVQGAEIMRHWAAAVKDHPQCRDTIEVPLWAARSGATPPVWLDAPIASTYQPSPRGLASGNVDKLPRNTMPLFRLGFFSAWGRAGLLKRDMTDCFGLIMETFGLQELPLGFHKAYKASRDMIW